MGTPEDVAAEKYFMPPDEDDFEHYYNGVIRLTKENTELKERIVQMEKERLPIDKDYNLLDTLKLIRKCIRNSRSAPNLIDTIDSVATDAMHKFLEYKQPSMGGDTSISSISTGEGRMP